MIINIEKLGNISIRNAYDIYAIMRTILTEEYKIDGTKEHFWSIALNQASKILNIELVSFGSYHSTASEPAETFSIPLQKKASSIILVHNQPSGNLEPTDEDIDITDRLYQVGKWMHIEVLDHLIVSEHSHFSFKDAGLMEQFFLSRKYLPSFELERRFQQKAEMIRREEEKQKAAIEKQVKQEGIKIGEEKGIEKGSKERERSIAKNMLKKGLDVNLIRPVA